MFRSSIGRDSSVVRASRPISNLAAFRSESIPGRCCVFYSISINSFPFFWVEQADAYASYTGKLSAMVESVLVLHSFVNKMPSSSSFFNLSNLPCGGMFCFVQASAGIAQWLEHPAQFKLSGFRIRLDSWSMLCFVIPFHCLLCFFLLE